MLIEIHGEQLNSERDLHRVLAKQLEFGTDGWNTIALRDRLLNDVERPIHLVWFDAELSRQRLGASFDTITTILAEAAQQDAEYGWDERFTYELR